MKLDLIHEFIVVAHYLNFSAAANNLHTSQPNLSKHISELEKNLGIELFFREKPLRLTPAGNAFLEDAIQIHHMYKEAVKRCQNVGKRTKEELIIQEPYIVDAMSEILFKSIMKFRKDYPCYAVKLFNEPGKKSVESLTSGKIDIALTVDCNNEEWMAKVSEKKGLYFIPVIKEPLLAWMNSNNPLAKEKPLTLDKLSGQKIIMTATRSFDPMRFAIIDLFNSHHLIPNLISYAVDTLNDFFMITDDKSAIYLVSPIVAQAPLLQMRQEMTTVAIDDQRAKITSYCVVTEHYEKKSIDAFLDTMEKVIKSEITHDEKNVYLPELSVVKPKKPCAE